jgi:hypothetical protein
MAVRRCRCGYTTDDVFTDGCPLCLRPMALVSNAGPPPTREAPPPRRPFRRVVPFLAGGVVLAMLVGLFGLSGQFAKPAALFSAPVTKSDSTGKIRVGMHVARVAAALEPAPLRSDPNRNLQDVLPKESTDSGLIVCRKGNRELHISFENGYVTGIRERPVGGPAANWAEVEFAAD